MPYYNRDLQRLKLKRKKLQWVNHGNCAKVFHYGDRIFKEYFPETGYKSRLKPEIFDILKNIDDEHFIKLYEIYSDMDLLELLIYMCEKHSFLVDSYIAKYYRSDLTNVLEEPVDYILDNFRELDILFDKFTENSIQTKDVKRENTVINCNRIILIDPDCFDISNDTKSTLKIENKKKLLHLFKSICKDSMEGLPNHGKMKTKLDGQFAENDINENTDIAHEISKKFQYVKKPIDYFRK